MKTNDYLTYALYTAFIVCFVLILWQFFWHKQWKMALLSLFFTWACGGGFLIALIIGWQEAAAWKIKKLMIVYSILLPLSFAVFMNDRFKEAMEPPPVQKAKKGAIRVAPAKPVK
jgi:hypothetical protein